MANTPYFVINGGGNPWQSIRTLKPPYILSKVSGKIWFYEICYNDKMYCYDSRNIRRILRDNGQRNICDNDIQWALNIAHVVRIAGRREEVSENSFVKKYCTVYGPFVVLYNASGEQIIDISIGETPAITIAGHVQFDEYKDMDYQLCKKMAAKLLENEAEKKIKLERLEKKNKTNYIWDHRYFKLVFGDNKTTVITFYYTQTHHLLLSYGYIREMPYNAYVIDHSIVLTIMRYIICDIGNGLSMPQKQKPQKQKQKQKPQKQKQKPQNQKQKQKRKKKKRKRKQKQQQREQQQREQQTTTTTTTTTTTINNYHSAQNNNPSAQNNNNVQCLQRCDGTIISPNADPLSINCMLNNRNKDDEADAFTAGDDALFGNNMVTIINVSWTTNIPFATIRMHVSNRIHHVPLMDLNHISNDDKMAQLNKNKNINASVTANNNNNNNRYRMSTNNINYALNNNNTNVIRRNPKLSVIYEAKESNPKVKAKPWIDFDDTYANNNNDKENKPQIQGVGIINNGIVYTIPIPRLQPLTNVDLNNNNINISSNASHSIARERQSDNNNKNNNNNNTHKRSISPRSIASVFNQQKQEQQQQQQQTQQLSQQLSQQQHAIAGDYVIQQVLNKQNFVIQTSQNIQSQINDAAAKTKRLHGEDLFWKISVLQPQLAGKITGMLLEKDNDSLLSLLSDPYKLTKKINEALRALKKNQFVQSQQYFAEK